MISTKYIDRYIDKMRKIQDEILKIINTEKDNESLEEEIIFNFTKLKILDNNDVFRSFLHLISIIYSNHHQNQNGIRILENIILYYKKDILNNFKNCEIFTIFSNDKKILLFLLKSEILKIDKFLINRLKNNYYSTYFFPEVKDFLETSVKTEIEAKITDDFLEKRQIGENHKHICSLIRNDSIAEFITYMTKENLPFSFEIESSIFETNPFLIGKNPTLIEYASFFGSIQIFQYLKNENVELTETLWPYAIHGQNLEIFQILEDSNIRPTKETAKNFYIESIKCHHNDIATYIYDNYLNSQNDGNDSEDNNNNDNNNNDNNNNENNNNNNNNNENNINNENNNNNNNNNENNNNNNNNDNNGNDNNNNDSIISPRIYFMSYNFAFIKTELVNYSNFIDFCTYDYTFFVYRLMKTITPDDLNKKQFKKWDEEFDGYDVEFEETALTTAVSNDNNEVVKMLLSNDNIDAGIKCRGVKKIDANEDIRYLLAAFLISLILPLFSSHFNKVPILILFTMIYRILLITDNFSIRELANIESISNKSINYLYYECTALSLACYNDNTEIANLLLSRQDIDVNAIDRYSCYGTIEDTALTFALENDNEEIVKNLLSNPNIDVNIAYKNKSPRVIFKYSFFFLASALAFNKALLAIFCIVNIVALVFGIIILIRNPILLVAFIKRVIFIWVSEYLILFVLGKIFPKLKNIKSKSFKAQMNSLRVFGFYLSLLETLCLIIYVIELLSSFLYTTYVEKSPLHIALEKKNVKNAKLLLSNKNIDVNAKYISCVYNQENIDNPYSFDSYEEIYTEKTALNMAAEIGNDEIVELLLSCKNIDVNAKCKSSSYKKIEILNNLFISFYAIESIICELFATRSRKSSLEIAVENSNVEIVKSLLENHQIKNAKGEYKKLKQRQITNNSTTKEGDDETENKTNQILELLQKFIAENELEK